MLGKKKGWRPAMVFECLLLTGSCWEGVLSEWELLTVKRRAYFGKVKPIDATLQRL